MGSGLPRKFDKYYFRLQNLREVRTRGTALVQCRYRRQSQLGEFSSFLHLPGLRKEILWHHHEFERVKLPLRMLHLMCSGGKGLAAPWLTDLNDWLFGMLDSTELSFGPGPWSSFSFSLSSSAWFTTQVFVRFFMRSSSFVASFAESSLGYGDRLPPALTRADRGEAVAWSSWLSWKRPFISTGEWVVVLHKSRLVSSSIRSGSRCSLRASCADAAESEPLWSALGAGSRLSRSCLSRITCDCRRA